MRVFFKKSVLAPWRVFCLAPLIETGGQEPYDIGRRPAFTGKPVLEGAVRDMIQPGNCCNCETAAFHNRP